MRSNPPGDPTEPATLGRPRFQPTDASIDFVLTVVEGPDRGATFTLAGSHPSRVLVGTGPACELRLGDREVSRRHLALEPSGRRLRVTDVGSTNGTFVDGVAIVEVFLRGGEILRLGSTAIQVGDAPVATASTLPVQTSFGAMAGASTEMRRLYPLCDRLAKSSVTVVIEGETGTGKEVLAEALHEEGPRAAGPFVVFDCTAVPSNLVESELFGHERGAFTGAVGQRKGVFEQAHGGTLLIDEIGDLELSLQPKLLRAIERSEVRRVGGDRPIKVDVRVLAATRRDLDHEVQAGRFRDDLFHRLAVARIELPPLRRRAGDVPVLARHFWRALGGDENALPGDLLLRWQDYAWPGNVRELRNTVARRLALGELAEGGPSSERREAARESSGGAAPTGDAGADAFLADLLAQDLSLVEARQRMVEEFERRYIDRVLARHDGSVTKAATASGIAKRYFQRLKSRARK
ncbi:MAG TPA: sigma 54-interacting transcriptional regulator [Polyangiaceae bacterium]|jgi:transcriptional regulator with GAF, ATPase, and Fis domain